MITDLLLLAAAHGDLCSIEVLSDREVERGHRACDLLTTEAEAFDLSIDYGSAGDVDGDSYSYGYSHGYNNGDGYGTGDGDGGGYGGGYGGGTGDGRGGGEYSDGPGYSGRQLSIGALVLPK